MLGNCFNHLFRGNTIGDPGFHVHGLIFQGCDNLIKVLGGCISASQHEKAHVYGIPGHGRSCFPETSPQIPAAPHVQHNSNDFIMDCAFPVASKTTVGRSSEIISSDLLEDILSGVNTMLNSVLAAGKGKPSVVDI